MVYQAPCGILRTRQRLSAVYYFDMYVIQRFCCWNSHSQTLNLRSTDLWIEKNSNSKKDLSTGSGLEHVQICCCCWNCNVEDLLFHCPSELADNFLRCESVSDPEGCNPTYHYRAPLRCPDVVYFLKSYQHLLHNPNIHDASSHATGLVLQLISSTHSAIGILEGNGRPKTALKSHIWHSNTNGRCCRPIESSHTYTEIDHLHLHVCADDQSAQAVCTRQMPKLVLRHDDE